MTATFAADTTADPATLVATVESPGWELDEATVEDPPDLTIGGTTWRGKTLSREYDDGSVRTVTAYTDADPGNFSDDYLVLGLWNRIPANFINPDGTIRRDRALGERVSQSELGAFADGGDPYEQANILALTGSSVNYTGAAVADYVDIAGEKVSRLTATATLTADFGTNVELGTISGTIGGFQLLGGTQLDAAELREIGEVILGSANIGDSDSGFFTGNASRGTGADALAGKWGGRFHGNGASARTSRARSSARSARQTATSPSSGLSAQSGERPRPAQECRAERSGRRIGESPDRRRGGRAFRRPCCRSPCLRPSWPSRRRRPPWPPPEAYPRPRAKPRRGRRR